MILGLLGLSATAAQAAAGCRLGKLAELPVTMEGLSPLIPAKINGADAKLIADSGAFFNIITPYSADRFKLTPRSLPPGLMVRGATGRVDVKLARADKFEVLGVQFKDAEFLVGSPHLQALADGLIGQNLLNVADAEYDLANGVIRLFDAQGCGKTVLAYWDQTKPFAVIPIAKVNKSGKRHTEGSARVNGVQIRVIFDTGSPRSMLTLRAAKRVGVTPDSPGAVFAGLTGGLGRRFVESWIAPFKSFAVGDEEIQNTRLRIGAIELGGADMLIGADFFLSHRIYVANSQQKLYLTYNGGPVFRLDQASDSQTDEPVPTDTPAAASPVSATPPAVATTTMADTPTDAGGFSRRGAAFAARRDFAHALADFDRAAELEPDNPKIYMDRAKVELAMGKPPDALADLDHVLKLKPDDLDGLMMRGALRLAKKDEAGARADIQAAARLEPTITLTAAGLYSEAGLFEAALAEYDRWITDHPKDDGAAIALNGRCWTRALWGREMDKALADCDAAIKLDAGKGAFYDSRGLAHLRQGQLDESIADYDKALKLSPKVAWSHYGRGVAKLKKGLKTQGDEDVQAAARLDPGLPEKAKQLGVTP